MPVDTLTSFYIPGPEQGGPEMKRMANLFSEVFAPELFALDLRAKNGSRCKRTKQQNH